MLGLEGPMGRPDAVFINSAFGDITIRQSGDGIYASGE